MALIQMTRAQCVTLLGTVQPAEIDGSVNLGLLADSLLPIINSASVLAAQQRLDVKIQGMPAASAYAGQPPQLGTV